MDKNTREFITQYIHAYNEKRISRSILESVLYSIDTRPEFFSDGNLSKRVDTTYKVNRWLEELMLSDHGCT